MSYSLDLRKKVLELIEGGRTKEAVAKLLGIGEASLYRWEKKKRLGESLGAKRRKSFERKVKLQELESYVKEHADATLGEIQAALGYSIGAIWYRLKQMKITLKKITRYRERKAEDREAFIKQVRQIDPRSIVYIDESGVDNRLYRVYGRAKRGVKIMADIPGKSRSRISRLGGWMQHQLIAPLIFKGGCHQVIVNTWLSKELLPQLPKKTTVIMDKAAFHKTSKTRDLIEAAGCSLLYLPTYSPDLNPIEHCWHTIKRWLRPRIPQHNLNLFDLLPSAITQLYKPII